MIFNEQPIKNAETVSVKYNLDNITSEVSIEAHKCLENLANDQSSINWLLGNLNPKAIALLSPINEHLREVGILSQIIETKSLPPDYFD
jgi:hypothetical protein